MIRRNEDLRNKLHRKGATTQKNPIINLIKENQEEIAELSLPFKAMFEDSVRNTKEEIVQRNVKNRINI